MNHSTKKLLATSGAAMLLATTALAGGAAAALAQDDVTIEWWHIENLEPMKSVWQEVADAYMAENPNVVINQTVLENEAFKAKLTANMQAGDPPDLFQTWGGGTLAAQVDAGLVQGIDELAADWIDNVSAGANSLYNVDGTQYGVAFDQGMVGFWYNKDILAEAGYDEFPTTWAEYLEAVQAIKDLGYVPIALGEAEKWPGHFWWAYTALRECGADAMLQAGVDGDFSADCFVKAGADIADLVALDPFQPDFLAAPYGEPSGQAAWVANGQAAMELMGHWAPNTQVAFAADEVGLGESLGFANFPVIDGGAGAATEALGGGNGYAVGANAPAEAVDFLGYLSTPEVAAKVGEAGKYLPVVKGADASVADPNMQAVVGLLADSTYVQLYLDQAYAPAVGEAVNDNVAFLLAGQASPEEVAANITEAAQAAAE